ncbi:MAG TPA: hypothetical protein VG984_02710 [Candidatus Paceibacterota bacterium]|nr:hypothetical protein [Candidatus Paceibacterota bacterium]
MIKQFDTNGWVYDRSSMDRFQRVLAKHAGVSFASAAYSQFHNHGGKAFGLRLCQEMADRVGRDPFSVPDWTGMTGQAGWLDERMDMARVIVRSSSPTEDWLDGRAGVEESKIHLISESLRTTPNIDHHNGGVLQDAVDGIGYVVDIGYSELLGRAIVRVARGNPSRVHGGFVYTSATWDHESTVGIYELDGAAIVPLQADKNGSVANLVKILVSSVQGLGIDFGVQLELIHHPEYPPTSWKLVQIRPSPAAVRYDGTPLRVSGTPLEITGKVARCGSIEGDLIVLDERYRSVDMKKLGGKVVVWDCRQARVPYDILNVSHAGAVAQVCNGNMICNSSHGTFGPAGSLSMNMYEEASRSSLLVARSRGGPDRKSWVDEIHRKGAIKRLEVVSDGLVGEIRDIT